MRRMGGARGVHTHRARWSFACARLASRTVGTRSIQECIKDPSRTHEITEYIAKGRAEKMQTFDQHLLDLLKANKITVEGALNAASNPTDFQTKLEMEGLIHDDDQVDAKPEEPFDIEPDERF